MSAKFVHHALRVVCMTPEQVGGFCSCGWETTHADAVGWFPFEADVERYHALHRRQVGVTV